MEVGIKRKRDGYEENKKERKREKIQRQWDDEASVFIKRNERWSWKRKK